jgi:ATP-dependent DNA ligase
MNRAELARVRRRLEPLAADRMPLDVPPPRTSRFGSPTVLSRVHWVRPVLIAEVTFLTWTDDGLLRQAVSTFQLGIERFERSCVSRNVGRGFGHDTNPPIKPPSRRSVR